MTCNRVDCGRIGPLGRNRSKRNRLRNKRNRNKMPTPTIDTLTQDDWQYITFAVQTRINAAKPKPGEPSMSKAFKEQTDRIMAALMRKAYPMTPRAGS